MKSWKNLDHWGDWRPREGQFYYYVDSENVVKKEMWMVMKNNENNAIHYTDKNIFETEQKAKDFLTESKNIDKWLSMPHFVIITKDN